MLKLWYTHSCKTDSEKEDFGENVLFYYKDIVRIQSWCKMKMCELRRLVSVRR